MSAAADNLRRERELYARMTPELRKQLVRIARAYGCNREQSEDAVQDALVHLWRKPQALAPQNAGLLKRIAREHALKVLRSARRWDGSGGGPRYCRLDDLLEPGNDVPDAD